MPRQTSSRRLLINVGTAMIVIILYGEAPEKMMNFPRCTRSWNYYYPLIVNLSADIVDVKMRCASSSLSSSSSSSSSVSVVSHYPSIIGIRVWRTGLLVRDTIFPVWDWVCLTLIGSRICVCKEGF